MPKLDYMGCACTCIANIATKMYLKRQSGPYDVRGKLGWESGKDFESDQEGKTQEWKRAQTLDRGVDRGKGGQAVGVETQLRIKPPHG